MIKLVIFSFSPKITRLFFLAMLSLLAACSQTKPNSDILHQNSDTALVYKETNAQYSKLYVAQKQQLKLKNKLTKLEIEMLDTAAIIAELRRNNNAQTHVEIYVARLEAMNKSRIALLNRIAYWRTVIDNYPN